MGGKSFSLSAPLYYTAKKFTDDDFVIYEFCAYIYDSKSGYRRWLLFTVEAEWDKKMIVDAKEMRETTARVMERYQIPADRSEDLRTPAAN